MKNILLVCAENTDEDGRAEAVARVKARVVQHRRCGYG